MIVIHDNPLIIKSLSTIDPTTRWLKIGQYNDKLEDTILNLLYQA